MLGEGEGARRKQKVLRRLISIMAWIRGHSRGSGEEYVDTGYILKELKGIVNEETKRYVREKLRIMLMFCLIDFRCTESRYSSYYSFLYV